MDDEDEDDDEQREQHKERSPISASEWCSSFWARKLLEKAPDVKP